MPVARWPRFLAITFFFVATSAVARRRPPVPCDPGSFVLAPGDQAKMTALLGVAVDVFTFGPAKAVTLGPCGTTGKVKAKRRATIVTMRFPACGTATKAKVVVRMPAPDCSIA